MKHHFTHPVFAALFCFVFAAGLHAQSTAFTYQGRLVDSGSPVDGNYDVRFILYNASFGGSQVGSVLTNSVTALDGLFTTSLDFGPVHDGTDFWLELQVRPTGGDAFVALAPRQALLSTPKAQFATTSGIADTVVVLPEGSVGAAQILPGAVTASQIADGTITPVDLSSSVGLWNVTGANVYYNAGNVGIGDASPTATLSVGNGDKLRVFGADGDVVFNDDQGSIRFANAGGANEPMIQMFSSGTNNTNRMFVAHSPAFPNWGIRYSDVADQFDFIGDNLPVLSVQLAGQQRVGVGTFSPSSKFHVESNSSTGSGQIKLTESQFDYSRITMNNNLHPNFWDIAARTDTNLANATLNFYHSDAGDIFSVNAQGRVGINDSSPNYAVDINGNGSTRALNIYN